MKNSKKRKIGKTPKANKAQLRWEEVAAYYESDESLEVLAKGMAVSAKELRLLVSKGKTKPISIRIPEVDLMAIKRLSKKLNEGKYQKLIFQAIEKFIDEEEKKLQIA